MLVPTFVYTAGARSIPVYPFESSGKLSSYRSNMRTLAGDVAGKFSDRNILLSFRLSPKGCFILEIRCPVVGTPETREHFHSGRHRMASASAIFESQ